MACWNTKIEVRNKKINILSGDRSNSYYGKFWVGLITGIDPKFGLKRDFINDKDGAFNLKKGIFEIYRSCQWSKNAERYFIKIENGDYIKISKSDVMEEITKSDKKSKSEIFKNAWKIAKEAAIKFGGSSKDYISESLKIAYK